MRIPLMTIPKKNKISQNGNRGLPKRKPYEKRLAFSVKKGSRSGQDSCKEYLTNRKKSVN